MPKIGCPRSVWWLPLSLLTAGVPVLGADGPVSVSVDCSRRVEGPLNLWGYVNVSRRAPPPVELCARIEREYGRPRVTRCWLMLDQMWDYRTDAYRFDYEINKDYYEGDPNKKRYGVPGYTTGLCYYDYVDSVSAHSETVLMNIRRYEQEVLTGIITFGKWKEVFKAVDGLIEAIHPCWSGSWSLPEHEAGQRPGANWSRCAARGRTRRPPTAPPAANDCGHAIRPPTTGSIRAIRPDTSKHIANSHPWLSHQASSAKRPMMEEPFSCHRSQGGLVRKCRSEASGGNITEPG